MTTDELVTALDATHPGWQMYRAADGRWICRVPKDKHSTQDGATVGEALQALLAYRQIPVVPRYPAPMGRDGFRAERRGSLWRLRYGHTDCGRFTRKRDAEAHADVLVQRAIERQEAWTHRYGHLVAAGVEGKDYRWES